MARYLILAVVVVVIGFFAASEWRGRAASADSPSEEPNEAAEWPYFSEPTRFVWQPAPHASQQGDAALQSALGTIVLSIEEDGRLRVEAPEIESVVAPAITFATDSFSVARVPEQERFSNEPVTKERVGPEFTVRRVAELIVVDIVSIEADGGRHWIGRAYAPYGPPMSVTKRPDPKPKHGTPIVPPRADDFFLYEHLTPAEREQTDLRPGTALCEVQDAWVWVRLIGEDDQPLVHLDLERLLMAREVLWGETTKLGVLGREYASSRPEGSSAGYARVTEAKAALAETEQLVAWDGRWYCVESRTLDSLREETNVGELLDRIERSRKFHGGRYFERVEVGLIPIPN